MTALPLDLTTLHTGANIPSGEQRAHNTSAASENKIHDDDVARTYGFSGGLVPGATSYAYLAGHLARVLGERWVTGGASSIRLVRPVYEGERVQLCGEVARAEIDGGRGAVDLDCWVEGPDRTRRAVGTATLAWGWERAVEERPEFACAELPPRPHDERPMISLATAPVGWPLPPVLLSAGPPEMAAYLDGIDNHDPLFREGSAYGGPLVHPGWWAGAANQVLARNFNLGPWVHTGSEIQHLAPAIARGTYHGYGTIVDAFEKRGHEYVTLDVLIADGDDQPVVRLRHTAIVVLAAHG